MTTSNREFHHHTSIGTLRKTFGARFAKGCADNERLSDVLAKDASLRRVIRDHEAGKSGAARNLPRPAPRISVRELSMGADARYRDKSGEISRKHGHTLIGTQRDQLRHPICKRLYRR